MKSISSNSLERVLKKFSTAFEQEIQNHIIHLASLIFSSKNFLKNSIGTQEKTQEDFQNSVKSLSFHILPFGYYADAHADYQRNIYLREYNLSFKTDEFQRVLISLI